MDFRLMLVSNNRASHEYHLGDFELAAAESFLTAFTGCSLEHVYETLKSLILSPRTWVDDKGVVKPNRRSFKWSGACNTLLEITIEIIPPVLIAHGDEDLRLEREKRA